MPGGRQLAMGSYSYEPLIRDFRTISHLAIYSGLSAGAVGARPLDKSPVGAERVGGGGGVPRSAAAVALLNRIIHTGEIRRIGRGIRWCGLGIEAGRGDGAQA